MTTEPQLIVDFYGICTHLEQEGHRRVVLVNGSDPHRRFEHVPQLRNLAAHQALFQVERKDLISAIPPSVGAFQVFVETAEYIAWEMHGVTITVPNMETPVAETQPVTCIPRLSSLCPRLPSLGPAARDRNSHWTSCFFDYTPTRLEGRRTTGGAAVGRVALTTVGSPIVSIAPFDGSAPLLLELQRGARLVIANIPDDPLADKDQDFYLHFVVAMKQLTAADFPADAGTPPPATGCEPIGTYLGPLGLKDITTPGCSNSDYP